MPRRRLLAALTALGCLLIALPGSAASTPQIKADFVTTDYPGVPWEDQHITVKADATGKGKLTWDTPFKDWDTVDPSELGLPGDIDLKKYGKEIWLRAEAECVFIEGNVGTLAVQVTRSGNSGYGFPEAWIGAWLLVELHDVGPNGVGDFIMGEMVSQDDALAFCETGDLGEMILSYNDLVSGDIAIRH